MNAEVFLAHYERIAEAPDAISSLRRFILELAVRGKLVPQDTSDEPASELLKRIAGEKARLVTAGEIKEGKPISLPEGVDVSAPLSWRVVPLGDVINRHLGGGTPSKGNHSYWGGDIRWASVKDVGKTKYLDETIDRITEAGLADSSSNLIPQGNLLVVTRMGLGQLSINRIPVAINQDLRALFVSPFVDIDFVYNFFLTYRMEGTGLTVKGIKIEELLGIPFPLPPLAEQQRIVAKVDELMGLCDRLEAARLSREVARDRLAATSLARLNEPDLETFQADARFALNALPALTARSDQVKLIRKTIMNLAVRGKLVTQHQTDGSGQDLLKQILALPWKKKRKASDLEPDEAAMASAFAVPSNWTWATIQALSRQDQTVTYGILKPEWVEDGVPTVRVTEMKTGEIDVAILPKCRRERAAKFMKTTLEPGDLLVSKDGTIGKTAFVPPALAGGNITQHVLRFPICEQVDRHFVRLAIDAPFCQSWMVGETKGVALQGVNVGDFRRMPIPLPPLAEQHRIVAKVDALMALCDRLEAALATTDTTRARLLEALLYNALDAQQLEQAA